MGTRALLLLSRYWDRLQIVARAGGYYSEPFRGKRSVTQGDPLLPTIFNVMVETVVHHWEYLMAEGSGRDDSSGNEATKPARRTIRACDDGRRQTEKGLKLRKALIYADNGMVASTDPGWIHTTFDTMTRLFDQVDLKKNVRTNVGMVCHPFRAAGVRSDEAYTRWMTGAGRRYKERQRERVSCPECMKELARGSLAAH